MCGKCQENVEHIICGCSKLSQRDYKKRHETLARVVHWELCKVYDCPYSSKWYEHSPARITENEEVKILWDFTITTDREINHRRSDITVPDKNNNKVLIIDIAVPSYSNVESKERERNRKNIKT